MALLERSLGRFLQTRSICVAIFLPALGNLRLAAIKRADISKMMQNMKDTPGAANRTLQLLSNMMNVAENWGLRPDYSNPCRHVDRYKSGKRERFLSSQELLRLGNVLRDAEEHALESESAVAAIRLLILTGCRRGEILGLRWADVDLMNSCLRLSDSKTGPRLVHLNEPAKAVIAAIKPVVGNPFVITGAKAGGHLINLKKPWQRIRSTAELPDVRLHDLRHSFASVAIGLGESLEVIGKLLGHTRASTTERYAHLAADPVRAANSRIGQAISGMLNPLRGEC
jgi:integrase